jgi:phage tail-like protein
LASDIESKILLGGEPALANRFMIELGGGIEIGIFKEVHGLEVKVATEDFKEGGLNGYVHRVPGRLEWTNITFKRGLTQTDNLFKWFAKTSGEGFASNGNKLTPVTAAITAVNHTGIRLRTWNLTGVYPVRWKGPDFTGESAFLEEELEIAHAGFTPETFGQP